MVNRRYLIVLLTLMLLVGCRGQPAAPLTTRAIDNLLLGRSPEAQARELYAHGKIDRLGDALSEELGTHTVQAEGYGLVVGLAGRGIEGVPASPVGLSQEIHLQLGRQGIPDREKLINSADTAPVRVVIQVPPLVEDGARVDAELVALGRTLSLKGGLLLPAEVYTYVETPGGRRRGSTIAVAEGRITLQRGRRMVGDSIASDPRRGYIPGAAELARPGSFTPLPAGAAQQGAQLVLVLRQPNLWGVYFVRWAINRRFQEAIAETLATRGVRVTVPDRYCLNWKRFTRVLQEMDLSLLTRSKALTGRLETLARQLQEPDPATRRQASLALEAIGPPAAPVLQAACGSGDMDIRLEAATALAGINDAKVIPVLEDISRSGDDKQRATAAILLGMFRKEESIQQLTELLSDPSPLVRFRALTSLDALQAGTSRMMKTTSENRAFDLVQVTSKAAPAVVAKIRPPRRLAVFAPPVKLKTPFDFISPEVSLYPAVGDAAEEHVIISYTVMGKVREWPVAPYLSSLVQRLDYIGFSVNDIFTLVYELQKQGVVDVNLLWLDE